jgi:hypothetical protein
MQQTDEARATATRRLMAPIMSEEGAARRLALSSGLSEQTIRNVASTGIVSSMRTAKAIEAATAGAVPAEAIMQPGARGEQVYSVFPGDAIMRIAIQRRCEVGRVLASVGLTHQDLSVFSHGGSDAPSAVRTRVEAALDMLAISASEGDA